MKLSACIAAVILLLGATHSKAAIVPQGTSTNADIFTSSPAGAWAYYEKAGGGSPLTTFVPSQTAQSAGATFQSYVHPDPYLSGIIGGDGWQGTGTSSLEFFITYIQSSITQSISLTVIGDDGHSLFVDDVQHGGQGFGGFVDYTFTMQAGTKYKIELAGNNGPAEWVFGIGKLFPARDPAVNPLLGGKIESIANLQINADGVFAAPASVPEPASLSIWGLATLGCAIAGYRRRKLA